VGLTPVARDVDGSTDHVVHRAVDILLVLRGGCLIPSGDIGVVKQSGFEDVMPDVLEVISGWQRLEINRWKKWGVLPLFCKNE